MHHRRMVEAGHPSGAPLLMNTGIWETADPPPRRDLLEPALKAYREMWRPIFEDLLSDEVSWNAFWSAYLMGVAATTDMQAEQMSVRAFLKRIDEELKADGR